MGGSNGVPICCSNDGASGNRPGAPPVPAAHKVVQSSALQSTEQPVEKPIKFKPKPPRVANLSGRAATLAGKLFDVLDMDDSGQLEEAEGKKYFKMLDPKFDAAELDYYWKEIQGRESKKKGGSKNSVSKATFLDYGAAARMCCRPAFSRPYTH